MAEEFTGAIIYCPVCVSPIDAEAWGEQKHECPSCGTTFSVDLARDTVAAHAMHGG